MSAQNIGWAGKAAARLAASSLGTLSFGLLYNGTEERRMAHAVEIGCFRPPQPKGYSRSYQNFDVNLIQEGFASNGMVALVGLKATGKSTTVAQVLHQANNPVFVKMEDSDVYRAIFHSLRKGIWTLPFVLDAVRLDSSKSYEDVVIEAFARVKRQTGQPVTLGIDVVVPPSSVSKNVPRNQLEFGYEIVSKNGYNILATWHPATFVKRLKWLCADANVATAIFCTSEGLDIMDVKEPRLKKILGKELSSAVAKDYLHHLGAKDFTEEMLRTIPRTFAVLHEFAGTGDKQGFCDKNMSGMVQLILESTEPFQNVRPLYQKALKGPVDIGDIRAAMRTSWWTWWWQTARDPKQIFMDRMIAKNIFVPREDGLYELQFDCQRAAVDRLYGNPNRIKSN